eukprot:TRINITY_DN367_c1_g1_i1.p1 TRINITY_DN367_c1_g1~~TRINITY_DN367_c1_g1_i1.p1  ORF type:complete len:224 (+),score=127.43 TRINITY_DN367_c1_g1_i1:27-674(+)
MQRNTTHLLFAGLVLLALALMASAQDPLVNPAVVNANPNANVNNAVHPMRDLSATPSEFITSTISGIETFQNQLHQKVNCTNAQKTVDDLYVAVHNMKKEHQQKRLRAQEAFDASAYVKVVEGDALSNAASIGAQKEIQRIRIRMNEKDFEFKEEIMKYLMSDYEILCGAVPSPALGAQVKLEKNVQKEAEKAQKETEKAQRAYDKATAKYASKV